MVVYTDFQEWLSVIKKEYLEDFVRNGGATVKFAVPVEAAARQHLQSGLQAAAETEGYHFAFVDSANVKIHMIDQVFHQLAKQIDWDGLAYSFLVNTLKPHYRLPETRTEFSLKGIAGLNGLEESEMRLGINSRLKESLFKDYAMSQEFRIAMLRLCQAQLDPVEVQPSMSSAIKEWLRGELRLISALKSTFIFQKIGRHNARHLLLSLSHWLKTAGKGGLVLTLDISRYMSDRPAEPDGTLYYSASAVMDCYEVLRQFIDGTGESEYLMVMVLCSPQFVDNDQKRGIRMYDALKLRISDEVHDRTRANPLSSLVRVTTCSSRYSEVSND